MGAAQKKMMRQCEMTRFTDSPYERMMTRRPEGGKETSRPPSLPHNHPAMAAGIMEVPA